MAHTGGNKDRHFLGIPLPVMEHPLLEVLAGFNAAHFQAGCESLFASVGFLCVYTIPLLGAMFFTVAVSKLITILFFFKV